MSRIVIVLLIYHPHKPINLIYQLLVEKDLEGSGHDLIVALSQHLSQSG
jgi:hypothetical protein